MVDEMGKMQARHQEIVSQLDSQYRNIEQATQGHYVTFIQELKVSIIPIQ